MSTNCILFEHILFACCIYWCANWNKKQNTTKRWLDLF